jgi:PAS domain S-box-containing protein
VVITDPEGKIVYVNRTLPSIRPEEVLGTYPTDHFVSPFRERVRRVIDRVRETWNPERFEAEFAAPDGAEYAFEAKVAPLTRDGTVTYLLFNYNDITRKRELENRLFLREEQMRTALENLPVLVDAIGPDGRIVFWNRECERVTGYSAAEVLDNPDIWETMYPDDTMRERLFRCFGPRRDIRDSEWEIRRKDGGRRIISWSSYGGSAPIPGWNNWAVGIDRTDHRNTKEALRTTERLYQTLVDGLPDSVVLADASGAILAANPRAAEVRGFSSVEEMRASAKNILDLVVPEDRKRLMEKVRRSLAEKNPESIEYRALRKDGTDVPMELRVTPFVNDKDEPVRIIGVSRDLRKRKAAEAREREREAQMQHAARLASLGTIVSGVAHEINNPNHFMLMNAQAIRKIWKIVLPILSDHAAETPDFRVGSFHFDELRQQVARAFDNIQESSERITGIVSDLKDYSRPGHFRLDQFVDPRRVVSRSVRLLESMVKDAPFQLQIHCEETPAVIGNALRLEQVVVNLLQNAFFAMEDRPGAVRVDVGAGETPGTVEIRVADEGVGLPEADRTRITDPFFTTRRAMGGTGLGLAVSDKIVQDHGGRLVFESRRETGTRVRVVLPAAPSLPPERPTE